MSCLTPASPHDSTVLEDLVSEDERSLFGDKAYSRESLKQIARENGWYYGILDKAKRNAPLSHAQKKRNRKLNRVRAAVEHPFAWMKTKANLLAMREIGRASCRERVEIREGGVCGHT